MNQSNVTNSNLNNINNLNIATNLNTKYKKLNRTNFKTISSHNSSNNTSKSNNSKENVKIIHNVLLEKRKKASSNKKQKNEIKNCIPKIKTEIFSNSNIMNNNNSNLKNKKEFQPQQFQQRNSSFQHKKCNDLLDECQNKNLNFAINKTLTKVNVSNSKERLNSLNTNNTYNNHKNIKYSYIIKILLYYIESMHKKIKYFFHKNQIEKNNKIKELSLQNKFLMNENKNLKIKLIEFMYTVKLYTTGKYNLFSDNYSKLTKQLIQENNFLRKSNMTSKQIDGNYYNLLQKQIKIEKLKKELILQNQIKDLSSRSNKENPNNFQNINDPKNQNQLNENNPFYFNANTGGNEGINNKVKHKRQRTHFNLGALDDENNSSSNNSNRESINNSNNKSYASSKENISVSNTAIENNSNEDKKNNNALDNVLKEMISGNRALKKINGSSKKNLFEKNEISNNGEKAGSSNNIYTFIKSNKTIGNNPSTNIGKIINNIPFNTKNEHLINNKDSLENKSNNNYGDKNKNVNENENINSLSKKQQQSIYYRSAREKEKKKIEFTK